MRVIITLGISCLLAQVCASKRIPWWSIKIGQEQGPHACVVEEVPGTYTELWTECRYWASREICGQKTIIRYECCEGYQRIGDEKGCTSVKPLKNLLETAEDLGARKFVAAVRDSGLAPELTRDGAFTLFLPTDHAFERMSAALRSALEAGRGNPRSPVLLYHLLEGSMITKQMRADQLVSTRNEGAKLRINKYSNQMTTVNCHLVTRKDQRATNGVIHVIDGVLDPSIIQSGSVVDLVIQDGRFSMLAEALEASGYVQELRRMPGALTIMAPSDEAFQKIPQRRREKILNDKAARDALLRHHIIPHPVCQSAVIGEHKIRTETKGKVKFNCDRDSVFVSRTKLNQKEILGQNGVIHMLDDLLVPERAMNFLELAEKLELVTFLSLVRVAGLEEALGDFGDYTLFVPNENAFLAVPEGVMEAARSDTEAARQLLLFHGTQGRILSRDISDSQVVMSLDEENPLRLQVHRNALGVEDAIIKRSDVEGQNGVLHIIDRVLLPSNSSAGDVLRQEGGFDMFLMAMERVMSTNPLDLDLRHQGVHTIFAPNDDAFGALGQTQRDRLLADTDLLTRTVKNHITTRMLSSGSFQPGLTYQIATMNGNVDVQNNAGQLTVSGARVLKSDVITTNGLVHYVDRVLLPTEDSARLETRSGASSDSFRGEHSASHFSRQESSFSGTSGFSSTRASSASSRRSSSSSSRRTSVRIQPGTSTRSFSSSSRRTVTYG